MAFVSRFLVCWAKWYDETFSNPVHPHNTQIDLIFHLLLVAHRLYFGWLTVTANNWDNRQGRDGTGKCYFYPDILNRIDFLRFFFISMWKDHFCSMVCRPKTTILVLHEWAEFNSFYFYFAGMLNGDVLRPIFDAWIYGVAYKRATFEYIPLFVIVKFALSRRQQQHSNAYRNRLIQRITAEMFSVYCLYTVWNHKLPFVYLCVCVCERECCVQPICKKG